MRKISTLFVLCAIVAAWFGIDGVRAQGQRADEVGWGPAQPVVSFTGSYSQIPQREYQRVLDAESWRKLWERHAGASAERDSYGEVVVPAIDFEKFMVIAIFNGEGWNTRNMLLVESSDHSELHLRFDAGTYQTADGGVTEIVIEGEATPEEIERRVLENMEAKHAEREANKHNDPNYTAAYGMWVLPRTLEPVVLIENVQGRLGEPPIWEEQHRFERETK